MDRRTWMSWVAGAAALPVSCWAQPSAALQLGVDALIQDSGLAGRWKAAMARDTGLTAQWTQTPSVQLLQQLEAGTLQAGLFLSHPLADRLEQQGLIHDRHSLARTPIFLVGPSNDPAGLRSERDVVHALHQILAAQAAGICQWIAPAKNTALAGLSDTLMSTLGAQKLTSKTPRASTAPLPQYQLMTQSDWQSLPRPVRAPLKTWVSNDVRLSLTCQVARSFRTQHPAGKLLVQWLQSPLARRAVTGPGSIWQAVKG